MRLWISGAFFAAAIVACNKSAPPPDTSLQTGPFAGVNCAAVRPPIEPDLMAWDAQSRANLDRLRRQGVVAVRYEANGCDVSLEILAGCVGPKNRYVYSPYKSTETKIAHDANELFMQLPIGAVNVSSLLKPNRSLRTDFKLVGSVALPAGSTVTEYDLIGSDCRKATHVISAVYLGGFAMAAGETAQVANANLFVTQVPPGSESVAHEGYATACDKAEAESTELPGCAVPLRVALMPLDGKAPQPRCSEGYVFDGKVCASTANANRPLCATWGTTTDDPSCNLLRDTAAADPNGTSSGGNPAVFDQNTVERVVRQHGQNVKRTCWEGSAASLKRITVNVKTKVDLKGKVVQAEPELADADGPSDIASTVSRCIANEVRGWQFPEPESIQTFTVPFHLIRQ